MENYTIGTVVKTNDYYPEVANKTGEISEIINPVTKFEKEMCIKHGALYKVKIPLLFLGTVKEFEYYHDELTRI